MLPYNDGQWRAFFTEVGHPELADDPRFATMKARTANIDTLYNTAAGFVAQRDTASWLETCERLSIPAAPMNTLESLPDDPHLAAVGLFQTLDDADMGVVHFPGVPVKFDDTRPPIAFPPRLGEHSADILAELGLPADVPWARAKH
jgi:crotonobetainyl-CoA:carnitine CoA-transferase CaiB-like acyl-CoA transferase